MRISILGTRGIPPTYGGFETLAYELGKELAVRGHDVLVYGRSTQNQPIEAELQPRLKAHRSFTLPQPAFETILAGISSGTHALFRDKPDVALVCNVSNVLVAKILNELGIKVVLHVAGMEHTRQKWKGLPSFVLKKSVEIAVRSNLTLLTDSQAVADWYKENYQRELTVIPYGSDLGQTDTNLIKSLGLEPKEYDLVVARLEPDTQVAEIVRAHSLQSTKRLVVIGETRKPDAYFLEVQRALAAHPNCLVLGSTWDQKLLDTLWANADLYIHGHRTGGTNPALLRGAAAGPEVLHHSNPFNNEVTAGFAWTWNNESELGELLTNKPWTEPGQSKSNQLQKRTKDLYNWHEIANRYERLLTNNGPE